MRRLLIAVAVFAAHLLSRHPPPTNSIRVAPVCHALVKPTDTSFDRMLTRKGPDLWFAGSKFNAEWLVAWLQDPKPIRPAGYPYFKMIKKGTRMICRILPRSHRTRS